MGEVVPPESIIAIHEYWHSHARYLMSDYPNPDDETLKLVDSFRTIDEDYRKAVDFYLNFNK
jgi:hypothetical protein